MADPNDLAIVRHGAETIAEWRGHNPGKQLDLSEGSLQGMDLAHADLSMADLFAADLDGTTLEGASLEKATLTRASLAGTNLAGAGLTEATLVGANLHGARLTDARLARANMAGTNMVGTDCHRAIMEETNLAGANMDDADLSGATLARAYLVGADLEAVVFIDADLSGARVGSTSFAGCDLSSCRGLATVEHLWPSSIGLDTLTRTLRGAGGRWAPEMVAFFIGAGVAPTVLDYLTQQYAADPTQFTACVVTHAATDAAFATRLQEDLRTAGIRCYRHQEMATGPGIFASMDRATPVYDKLIVVCSESGLQRPHVIHELEQAMEEETALRQQKQTNPAVDAEIVFLLRLDDYLETGWQHPAKEECLRHSLGDCHGWDMDEAVYLRALHALLAALRQRPSAPA